jgi:hypothetical protein
MGIIGGNNLTLSPGVYPLRAENNITWQGYTSLSGSLHFCNVGTLAVQGVDESTGRHGMRDPPKLKPIKR